MKRKLFTGILLTVFSLFLCNITSFATGISQSEDYKWVKFIVNIPDDMIFDYNIAIELTNKKTNQVTSYKVDNSDNYVSYQNLDFGTYFISNVKVVGEYEGYFNCGYSKDSFVISKSSEDITELPVIIEFFTNSSGIDSSNEFENMTLEEVMNHINKESANSNMIGSGGYLTEESQGTEENNDSDESEEKLTVEKKIEQAEKEQAQAEKAEQKKKENSILPSFLFMCLVLVVSGIAFYLYKKKNSI